MFLLVSFSVVESLSDLSVESAKLHRRLFSNEKAFIQFAAIMESAFVALAVEAGFIGIQIAVGVVQYCFCGKT
jgi:hypothetical protein